MISITNAVVQYSSCNSSLKSTNLLRRQLLEPLVLGQRVALSGARHDGLVVDSDSSTSGDSQDLWRVWNLKKSVVRVLGALNTGCVSGLYITCVASQEKPFSWTAGVFFGST